MHLTLPSPHLFLLRYRKRPVAIPPPLALGVQGLGVQGLGIQGLRIQGLG